MEHPGIKVIKSCIYGVKCSGNQAIRLVAELLKDKYPLAYEIIMRDVYVDDCISGNDTSEERDAATDQVKLGLVEGGFTLKGFTFSGEDPDITLSADGESIIHNVEQIDRGYQNIDSRLNAIGAKIERIEEARNK